MLRLTHGTDTIGTPGFALLEQMRLSQNKRADVSEEIYQSHLGVGNHLLLMEEEVCRQGEQRGVYTNVRGGNICPLLSTHVDSTVLCISAPRSAMRI